MDDRVIDWLLASPTPSIRYLTLTRLVGLRANDEQVLSARQVIASSGPAVDILAQQAPEGHWMNQRHYYSPKYTSSHWSMLLLCELGLDPRHAGLQAGADHMLSAVDKDISKIQVGDQKGWGCFWGNWLHYQLYCGKINDRRVDFVISYLIEDIKQRSACPYNEGLPCAWGAARALFGLAMIPDGIRTAEVEIAIRAGISFLVNEYQLDTANYPYVEKIHPVWSKISFPLFYQADKLFVLRVLKMLGAHQLPGVRKAREQLTEKRTSGGQWRGSSPYRSKTWPFMSEGDTINRWVTLYAMDILS